MLCDVCIYALQIILIVCNMISLLILFVSFKCYIGCLFKKRLILFYKECGITVHLNTKSCLSDAVLFVILTKIHVMMKMVTKSYHLHLHLHSSMMEYTRL
jgi:hypothetical protein